MGFRLTICLLLMNVSLAALSVNELVPVYTDTANDISIDGRLDERIWGKASTIDQLVEVYPDDSGRKPELETEIKVLYTPQGLYVGFWCETPKDKQLSRLSFRDGGGVERDWFRVSIDPSGQGVNGYYMVLALGGSIQDGTIVQERRRIGEWDGPWEGMTTSDDRGWSGEMFFPWSMFAMPDTEVDERQMGIHFERWVSHLNQRWSWEPLSERDSKYLSGFSKLRIRNLHSKSSLTFYPYAAGSSDQLESDQAGKGGFDLFWNPVAGMRVAATGLPDFGQVESDAVVVNLSAFETFFPEKRPFFLEDRDIYNTRKLNLVHTRRIGGNPDLAEIPEGYSTENAGGASDITAASKVTGQQGNYRYGAMVAMEDDTQYTVINDETGERTDATSEGRDYYTGRLLREKVTSRGAYYSFGWLGTMVDRPAIDRQAQVNALDGTYRSAEGKWNASWQALSSDIDEAGESDNGYGGWVDVTWRPQKGWLHRGDISYYDDSLNINDMGFLRRNDERRLNYRVERNNTELPGLRGRKTVFKAWLYENNQGFNLGSGIAASRNWKFNNMTAFFINAVVKADHWDDRVSRDNGIVRRKGLKEMSVAWDSDPRNKWGLFTDLRAWMGSYSDKLSYRWMVYSRYTLNDHVDFRLSTSITQDKDWLLWREETTFATYNSTKVSPTLRSNILFSPRQDLRFVMQWYAVKARTQEVLALQDSGGFESLAQENPVQQDFAIGSLAVQVRYRYEIAPLSDFFAVYSRGGYYDDSQAADLSNIWSGSLSNKTADQFLVKLRYRFG